MTKGCILVVDDEPDFTHLLKWQLEKRGYHVFTDHSGKDALETLSRNKIDVLLADVRMPGMSGIELVSQALAIDPDIQCIVITGHGDVDTAIDAMRAGAMNFIKKPAGIDELDMAVTRAIEKLCLIREARSRQIELEKSCKELNALKAQLESLLDREHAQRVAAETALNDRIQRETLVEVMTLCLRFWKQSTGQGKVEFAEATRIWNASVDSNGTYRTRTLDKYLKISTLPPHPRHRDVLDSAYVVLSQCPLSPDMKSVLESKVTDLEKLIISEAG